MKIWKFFFIFLVFTQLFSLFAETLTKDTESDAENDINNNNNSAIRTYDQHPEAIKFVDYVHEKHGWEKQKILDLFSEIEIDSPLKERILKRLNNPPEKKKEWINYKKQFVNPERISKGIEFYNEHKEIFKEISTYFGVPSSIILATLGIESFYGSHKPKYQVLSTLVINSFTVHKRNKFYQRELEHFIMLINKNQLTSQTISSIHGSYSGAIGPAQFIPSSIYYYGYDFDGDNQINFFNNFWDIIASIANYYKKAGWNNNKKTVKKVSPASVKNDKDYFSLIDENNEKNYWLKQHNFNVILRYNRNNYYAMSVYLLAQEFDKSIK